MSDHYHYGYADERHDHRGQYAEDRHDHDGDYAEKHHRHYDLETDDEKASRRITALQDEADWLRGQLDGALGRIGALENTNTMLATALRKLAAGHEEVRLSGLADDYRLAIAEDLAEAFTALAKTLAEPEPDDAGPEFGPVVNPSPDDYGWEPGDPDYDDPAEPEPDEYDPGPEADDEGGMSEYRYTLPEDYQRGQS